MGVVLFAGSARSYTMSVPEAELQAAWQGLSIAIQQFGFKRICLEGDSLTVIHWIANYAKHSSIAMPH